ncbi:MAG: IS4 family transposase [Rhodothermales bacterium]
MLKHPLQTELDAFFKAFASGEGRQVTKSAFSQARKKFKHTAFIELNDDQVSYFYNHFAPDTWHSFRLLAIDGTMATLPNNEAIGGHFGYWHPQAGGRCPKARISQLFDVLNKISVDARIAPKDRGERDLANEHLVHLRANDLVLLDRGYPAFWLFSAIRGTGAHFCSRMSLQEWKVVKRFLVSGLREQIVEIEPAYSAKKACKERGLSQAPIPVRLLRIELSNGQTEVLATSLLDQARYPYELFKELYIQRWPIEEDYKAMKSRLEIENWSGESVESVRQDFHATFFAKNLAAILAQPAQHEVQEQSAHKKYTYKVNMTHLYGQLKMTIVKLFTAANPLKLLRILWHHMTKTIEPIRPNRSNPRKKRVSRLRYPKNYKSIP